LITDEDVVIILLIAFPSFAIAGLTIVHWLASKKFKVLARQPSLGIKLEEYNGIASVRLKACVYSSLLVAAGLLFTNHEFFGIYFGVIILWSILFVWPSPRRVCKDLRLKRDEEKMVMTKGEAFKG
jgi:4-hydroxybenzoate polyprenyltransferase